MDRRKRLANTTDPDDPKLTQLIRAIHRNLIDARGAGRMSRSRAAAALWENLYGRMADDDPMGTVGHLTSRAEAQVLRFSMIQALMNGSTAIDTSHLESAWEMWRYSRWSVQHIWSPHHRTTGDRDLDRIVQWLDAGEDLSGRDMDRMFGDRVADVRAKAVDRRIAKLAEIKPPPGSEGGRPAILLRATDKPEQRNKPWWTTVDFRRGDV